LVSIGFAFFNEFVGTVYYYLCPDVMPRNFMGRFQGISSMAGTVIAFFTGIYITPYGLSHMKALHVGVAVLYFFGFGLMCWRVKEGQYPPVEDVKAETTTMEKIKLYFRECFTHKIFIFFYLSTAALALTKGLNPAMVFGLHLNQHKQRVAAHPMAVEGLAHVNRDANLFSSPNNGLTLNDEISIKSMSAAKLPPTLSSIKHYYVINPTSDSFQLALTPNGPAITLAAADAEKAKLVPAEFKVGFAKIMPCPLAATPDCSVSVSSGGDGQIRVWELVNGKEMKLLKTANGPGGAVFALGLSENGKTVAAGAANGKIEVWDVAGGSTRKLDGHAREVKSLVFSKDGTRLLSASADKTIKLWDAGTGQLLKTFSGHEEAVNCAAFSSDEKQLASGGTDKKIILWNVAEGTAVKTLTGSPGPVNAVCFAPALEERKPEPVSFWMVPVNTVRKFLTDVFTNESLYDVHPDKTSNVSGEDLWIISGGQDGAKADENSAVRIWDVAQGTLVNKPLKGHKQSITSVMYKPDIRAILSGSMDASVRLWRPAQISETADDQAFKNFSGYTHAVAGMACQNSGVTLLNASEDGTLHVWDIDQGVSLQRVGAMGSFMKLFTLLLAYPLGILLDRWNPMKVALWTGLIGLPFTVAYFFFYHSYTFGLYMNILRTPVSLLAGYAAMPMLIMMLPKAKYGQFCSANAMVKQAVAAVAGVSGAVYMDWLTTSALDTDNYRWGFIFQASAHALSLLAMVVVYQQWKKLGGDNYVAPEAEHPSAGEKPCLKG
jgi:WD40 repeat protein